MHPGDKHKLIPVGVVLFYYTLKKDMMYSHSEEIPLML